MNEWTDTYHPFNSAKHFSQIYRWKQVGRTPPPAPASISLDPSNVCQLDCKWCNSAYIREHNPQMIDRKNLLEIASHMRFFTDHPRYGGVEAVCIAGGGEPLTNPHIEELIGMLHKYGIKAGLITNGVLLDTIDVSKCEWLGVSVDAGTRSNYQKYKGQDKFDKVLENIARAVRTKGDISRPGRAHGVNYKFVMHPGNIGEIYAASLIARDLGCRSIHIRPYAVPYKGQGAPFSEEDIRLFREQLTMARELETEGFRVYGITHKFGEQFQVSNDFRECHAITFSCTIQPPTNFGFDVSLCCDRRGDPKLRLQDTNVRELKEFWGSKEHLDLVKMIDPSTCPRCTRGPHNKVYQCAVQEDNMSHEFG